MDFSQSLGWFGNLLFFISAILLAKKNSWGWIGQFLANVLYIIQSFILNNPSLLWLSVGLGLFNLYGLWEWTKKPKKNLINNKAELDYCRKLADLYNE